MSKIQLGISSCLMGQKVRFDSGHKLDRYITKTLNAYFEYLPFCPEMAIGLGTPRPAIRLQQQADKQIRAVMLKTDQDHTDALRNYADSVLPKLANISGYILKSKSPSCGMERVKVYDTKGMPVYETSPGIYAGRLNAPLLRENFIKRVFVYHDWLIKHYLTGIDDAFIKQQSYLSPYPDELGLMAKL